jgi:hypothetical protein
MSILFSTFILAHQAQVHTEHQTKPLFFSHKQHETCTLKTAANAAGAL